MMRPDDLHRPLPAPPMPGRFALAHPMDGARIRPPTPLAPVAAAIRAGHPRRVRP